MLLITDRSRVMPVGFSWFSWRVSYGFCYWLKRVQYGQCRISGDEVA